MNLRLVFALAVSVGSFNAAHAASEPDSQRVFECVSGLRGIADMEAVKQNYTVVSIGNVQHGETKDSVTCLANFSAIIDGKLEFTRVYSGAVAKDASLSDPHVVLVK